MERLHTYSKTDRNTQNLLGIFTKSNFSLDPKAFCTSAAISLKCLLAVTFQNLYFLPFSVFCTCDVPDSSTERRLRFIALNMTLSALEMSLLMDFIPASLWNNK